MTCPPLLAPLTPPVVLHLTIFAVDRETKLIPPRTKKNHPMIVKGLKHPILLPSPAYREWEEGASRAMLPVLLGIREALPLTVPVNCAALIYRNAKIGDACGYYQAIGDFLQHNVATKRSGFDLRVVEDDKLLVSWDGSRLLKDAKRPRIELTLTEVRDA